MKLFSVIAGVLCLTLACGCGNVVVQKKEAVKGNISVATNAEEEKEKTPLEIKEEYLDKLIRDMSLQEKVGQLFMLAWRTDAEDAPIIEMNKQIAADIKDYKLGGVILFSENIDTQEQTTKLIQQMQQKANIPLFVGIDEEGGIVSRLSKSGKIDYVAPPPAAEIGAGADPAKAYEEMARVAVKLKEIGFNLDFAPDADINTNPDNPVIGSRAYGNEPNLVADMVAGALQGLQSNGISACAKHFPGHGDTATDTHTTETVITHDLNRLQSTEFIPFERAAKEGIDFIMAAHIKAPNITQDNLPASMSKEMITGILRQQLGYNGIIITDALDMGAITQYYTSEEIAVACVNAGIDIMLMPKEPAIYYEAVLEAIENGEIDREQVNQSVRRILSVKYDRGLIGEIEK